MIEATQEAAHIRSRHPVDGDVAERAHDPTRARARAPPVALARLAQQARGSPASVDGFAPRTSFSQHSHSAASSRTVTLRSAAARRARLVGELGCDDVLHRRAARRRWPNARRAIRRDSAHAACASPRRRQAPATRARSAASSVATARSDRSVAPLCVPVGLARVRRLGAARRGFSARLAPRPHFGHLSPSSDGLSPLCQGRLGIRLGIKRT